MDEEWGRLPEAYDPEIPEKEERDLFPIIGQAGEKSKSARPRAGTADAPHEDKGDAAPLDQIEQAAAEPAEKKSRKAPKANKLLKKMGKRNHAEHKHLQWVSLIADDNGRFHCNACGTSFSTVASTRESHWESKKHKDKVAEKLAEEEKKKKPAGFTQVSMLEVDKMAEAARRRKEEEKLRDRRVAAHRKRVLKAFAERGLPIDVLDGDLRELLEEARPERLSLGHKSHLARDFMDGLADEENELLVKDHRNQEVAINYDATPMNDDVAIVVSRTCTEEFSLQHRLVAVKRFKRSLTSAHWQNVISTTVVNLRVPSTHLTVGLSDGCNVMVNLGKELSNVYENLVVIFCHPHVWQKITGKFSMPELDTFMKAWKAVFKNSFGARGVFEDIVNERLNLGHKIRWNAKWEQKAQVAKNFVSVPTVIKKLKEAKLCKDTLPKLEKAVEGQLHVYSDLQLQLAANLDAGAPFVTITKRLEGSGFLAPYVVFYTLQVKTFISQVMQSKDVAAVLPNVAALLRQSPDHVDKHSKWAGVKNALRPGFDYAWKVMGGTMDDEDGGKYSLELFKVAQLCHPSQAMNLLKESPEKAINFAALLSGNDVKRFFGQSLCADLLQDADKLLLCHRNHQEKWLDPDELLKYWKDHGSEMGSWAAAARKLVLCLPNSCLAERAGSIVRSRISDQQGAMLEQTFETYCQLAFRYAEGRDEKKEQKQAEREKKT